MWPAESVLIAIQEALLLDRPPKLVGVARVAGGCINQAYELQTDVGRYFVKTNRADRIEMFDAEAAGLNALAGASAIKVPKPITVGRDETKAFLVTEYIVCRPLNVAAFAALGRQLAVQHTVGYSAFGWIRDNTLGNTPQPNGLVSDWITFLRDYRLGFQLQLAETNGFGKLLAASVERLLGVLPAFFAGYDPCPSLLHGDLWSGNVAMSEPAGPVIFDPAVYFGDREADMAMTELFGGFAPDFYAAYQEQWPLDPGYLVRKNLYNLYHILNHANLFGGGYARQAKNLISGLLAEVQA